MDIEGGGGIMDTKNQLEGKICSVPQHSEATVVHNYLLHIL
jgi:hypothetical protein